MHETPTSSCEGVLIIRGYADIHIPNGLIICVLKLSNAAAIGDN